MWPNRAIMMPSPSRRLVQGCNCETIGSTESEDLGRGCQFPIANWAPFPEVRPFESDGRVRTTSREASSSNCAMTGPGRQAWGVAVSVGPFDGDPVPVQGSCRSIDAPHPHVPAVLIQCARITTSVPASSAPHAGSLGCVPRSRTTDHDGSVGAVLASGRAMTVGSSPSDVSNVARTRSGTPSCPRSARRGWVTARWPPFPVAQYGRVVEMRRSPSLHSKSLVVMTCDGPT